LQAQSPEFKPQSHQKKLEKEKEDNLVREFCCLFEGGI
jgi:hypothetical protein